MLDFAQSETENSPQGELTASGAAATPGNAATQALQTLARDVPFEKFGLVAFDPDSFAWWSGNEYA